MLTTVQPRARRGIEAAVESADGGCSVVRVLAHGIVVVNEQSETWSRAARDPFEHLEIAVGVAERGNGTAADLLVDADGLAGLVVDEVHLGQAGEHGLAVAKLEFRFDAAADDLLWRNPIDPLRSMGA